MKNTKVIHVILIAVITIIILFNQYQVSSLYKVIGGKNSGSSVKGITSVIPTGIPAVYGAELNIAYDDIDPNNQRKADTTISSLGQFDNSISLDGELFDRYIKIGMQISCEYCCGAEAIIFSNGKAACGCAHSFAMRGLAKYLLKNHASEFTDDQILEELGKWKTLFFPGIMAQKAAVLKEKGIELNYINLASNKYRGIEQGKTSSGGMVGGC
ncbi:MAG: hypothetical protein AB1571_00425 [Nanoarchaeota archaeon]